ncbi:MAG: MFS transporter [Chloroflexi bacterium]|nr:MFS transporter [Chloroflexota bacterium]
MAELGADVAATTASTGVTENRAARALFVGACFLYWMALYLYVPTLSTYAESKSPDNLELVGIVIAQYGLWQTLIRIPLGIVADWVGRRKPFILAGIAMAGLGAFVMGSSGHINGLIAGRAITGLAAGVWVLLVVGFSSLFPPDLAVQASATLNLASSAGRVLATGANGWLNAAGGYSLAFTIATVSAGLALLTILPFKEQAREGRRPSLHGFVRLSMRRDVITPTLLSTVAQYASWATTLGFTPILAKRLGATDVALSLLVSGNMVVGILGNLVTAAAIRRIGARRMVVVCFVMMCLGIAGVAVAPTLGLLFVAQGVQGLFQGAVYPVLLGMSIEHVDERERSTAMGVHQAIYGIGMTAGPALGGVIAEAVGIAPMFLITAAACLIAGVLGARQLAVSDR